MLPPQIYFLIIFRLAFLPSMDLTSKPDVEEPNIKLLRYRKKGVMQTSHDILDKKLTIQDLERFS